MLTGLQHIKGAFGDWHADEIGCYQLIRQRFAIEKFLQEPLRMHGSLAVACNDNRAPAIVMRQVVKKCIANVGISKGKGRIGIGIIQ